MTAKKFVPSQLQIDVERYAQLNAQIKELTEEQDRLKRKFKKYLGKTLIGVENKATIFMQGQTSFLASVAKKFLTAAQYKKCQVHSEHLRVRITPFTGSDE